MLVGSSDFIVSKTDGRVFHFGSGHWLEENFEAYEAAFDMRFQTRILFCIFFTLLPGLVSSYVRDYRRLEWRELRPILKQYNLNASDPPERQKEIIEIEAADAKLYRPLAGKMIYLAAPSPTPDSRGLKPRYWLRVEDYPSAELAAQRASEYATVGTYERLEKAYPKADSFMISKTSVRLWAMARGKRVYALTTDTNLFTLIKLPVNLRKSIAKLPET